MDTNEYDGRERECLKDGNEQTRNCWEELSMSPRLHFERRGEEESTRNVLCNIAVEVPACRTSQLPKIVSCHWATGKGSEMEVMRST